MSGGRAAEHAQCPMPRQAKQAYIEHARGTGFAGPPGGAPWGQERSDWGAQSNVGVSTPSTLCNFGLVVVYCR
jgi:hypothetical protein